jgi:hypothetical protein
VIATMMNRIRGAGHRIELEVPDNIAHGQLSGPTAR